MAVTLVHDGGRVTGVDAVMERAPWTSCPGAPAVLRATFEGVTLSQVAARGEKQANCTHLHDLATLAAAHAHDPNPLFYEILVCDPIEGRVVAEIHGEGVLIHHLELREGTITAPEALAGASLFKLRGWIDTLAEPEREAARLLQWGTILAHGRAIPMEQQSDALRMPPNCFTFQPGNRERATRVGRVLDFSGKGAPEPLDHLRGSSFQPRETAE